MRLQEPRVFQIGESSVTIHEDGTVTPLLALADLTAGKSYLDLLEKAYELWKEACAGAEPFSKDLIYIGERLAGESIRLYHDEKLGNEGPL